MHRSLLIALAGCAGAPAASPTGDTGAGSTPADPLPAWVFVVDASPSMRDEAEALAVALGSATFPEGSLAAVVRADGTGVPLGPTVDAGGVPITEQIVCGAVCPGDGALPPDPEYTCGEPFSFLSQEVVDCACGAGWTGHCSTTPPQGLESAHQALAQLALPATHRPSVIVVTDEGDDSPQVPQGDAGLGPYEALLAGAVFSAIAPALDAAGEVACPGTATDWGVQRYEAMAAATGGQLLPIHAPDCDGPADLGAALAAILAAAR